MVTFVVYGPAGCGKTNNAEKIRDILWAKGVADGWDNCEPVRPGFVHLTNVDPGQRVFNHKRQGGWGMERVVVLSYAEIMK